MFIRCYIISQILIWLYTLGYIRIHLEQYYCAIGNGIAVLQSVNVQRKFPLRFIIYQPNKTYTLHTTCRYVKISQLQYPFMTKLCKNYDGKEPDQNIVIIHKIKNKY